MPLPQQVVSCRGRQPEPDLSGSREGLPQDTAPMHLQTEGQQCVEEHRREQPDKLRTTATSPVPS